MICRRRCWLSLSMVMLVATIIATASRMEPLRRTLPDWHSLVTESGAALCARSATAAPAVSPALGTMGGRFWLPSPPVGGFGLLATTSTPGTCGTVTPPTLSVTARPPAQEPIGFRPQFRPRPRIWIASCRKSAAVSGCRQRRPVLLHRSTKAIQKSDRADPMLSAGSTIICCGQSSKLPEEDRLE